MSATQRILFFLGHSYWLTWIEGFLQKIPGNLILATYAYQPLQGIRTFPLSVSSQEVVDWVLEQKPGIVVLLTNQDAVLRDADIGEKLIEKGISVTFQPQTVAKLGADKIQQKDFLHSLGFPTGNYRVSQNIDQTIRLCDEIGYPAVLKVANLSDSRKLSIATSREDVYQYYYNNAIDQQILIEEYLEGFEVSTIVFSHLGSHIVFPTVYKSYTDYRMRGIPARERIYVSPHPVSEKIDVEIQALGISIAEAIGSQGLLGIDIGVAGKTLHIFELNTRLTETIRMSSILTNFNIFQRMVDVLNTNRSLTTLRPKPIGVVVELPIPTHTSLHTILQLRQMDGIWLSTERITIFGDTLESALSSVDEATRLLATPHLMERVIAIMNER